MLNEDALPLQAPVRNMYSEMVYVSVCVKQCFNNHAKGQYKS